MLADSRMSFDEFMRNCGAEFNRTLMESPAAWQKVADASNAIGRQSGDGATNAIQDAVDVVATQCSNAANTAAGWLGL